jgi:hypothetical protein
MVLSRVGGTSKKEFGGLLKKHAKKRVGGETETDAEDSFIQGKVSLKLKRVE